LNAMYHFGWEDAKIRVLRLVGLSGPHAILLSNTRFLVRKETNQ